MQLRNYQQQAINDIYAAWNNGARNVLLQLSTGGGKTVVFSHIVAELKIPTVIIAHRTEIVSQISLTLARYQIKHTLIAQKQTVRDIIALHMSEFGKSFFDPQSRYVVAGVDTLLRLQPSPPWFKQIQLVIQDEGHHPLLDNKWGRAAALFPNARGLYPTATPCRADGRGLGRHADGLIDHMVVGPPMRLLIEEGFLSDYAVYAPPNDLDLTSIPIGNSGDYSQKQLRAETHKSHIHGDIISHYLKLSSHKLGITFAVDIEAANKITQRFREAGVSAEVISSKTPDLLRAQIMRRFRNREVLQLVNVDLLGEGVDVPAVEVVSMARATQSYALFAQQFGRALRPMPGKGRAIIIDHVGNTIRHGLPDDIGRQWTLDRRESRARGAQIGIVPIRSCLNPTCFAVYPRIYKQCPYCGFYPAPIERSSPAEVDGDLIELTPETLAKLRGEIDRVTGAPRVPQHLDRVAQQAILNRHHERQEQQNILRQTIAQWAGCYKAHGYDDSMIYRQFYYSCGIDIATAQTLSAKEAKALTEKLNEQIKTWRA